MQDTQTLQRTLLRREIARIVEEAQRRGAILRTGQHAAKLFAAYAGANWSLGHIIDELIVMAAGVRVVVGLARPNRRDDFYLTGR